MASDEIARTQAATDFKFPFAVSTEWLKPFAQGSSNACVAAWHEALGFAAARLQEQADYVRKLSESKDPGEAVKTHTDFIQASLKQSYDDATKLFESFRTKLSPAPPAK